MSQEITKAEEVEKTKLLGAHVPEELYWAFKNASAQRKESMSTAITHAALMYMEAEGGKE